MNIYVHKDGTQYGPYTLEQLQQYLQQGSFTLQDQACHDGQNWVTIAQVPGIAQAATSPAQPASQPQAQTMHYHIQIFITRRKQHANSCKDSHSALEDF